MDTDVAIQPFTVTEIERVKTDLRRRAPVFAARVASVYALLQWRWARPNKDDSVPSEKEILAALMEFIRDVMPHERTNMYVSSGGLTVYAEKGQSSDISCGFTFELQDDGEVDRDGFV